MMLFYTLKIALSICKAAVDGLSAPRIRAPAARPAARFEAWIVSREDLILSKLVWAKDSSSEIQLRDVQALLAGGADRTYLERWATELSVKELLHRTLDAGHRS
jgi:hypothetical protein